MGFSVALVEYSVNFLYSLLLGAFFGLIYDIFRIIRIAISGVGIGTNKPASAKIDELSSHIIAKSARGRKAKKNRVGEKLYDILVFIQDVLFFLIAAMLLTVFLYCFNFGQLRLYIYIGVFAGFLAYYNTVGRLIAAVSGLILSVVKLLIIFLVYSIITPIVRALWGIISAPVNYIKIRHIIASSDRRAAKLFVICNDIDVAKS